MMARSIARLLLPAFLAGCFAVGCSLDTTKSDNGASEGADITEKAQDPTGLGPSQVADAEYKLPAATDPDILSDRMTEIWAHMWRPATMAPNEKHPLLVFLHGNHGTCGTGSNPRSDDSTQYTQMGTCPDGYVVTPNHMGYAYIAERLASWGYIVVSINANRGITAGEPAPGDGGLNLARGRLVLKHLSLLSQWNQTPGSTPASLGVDLAGAIDFDQIGMMGHSRGGEGVRAALNQYQDPGSPWPAKIASPLGFKAIFEIGPVDGQTSRVLDANGVAWNVVLPMCDGDVSNLQGMKPFDRMLAANSEPSAAPKGMFGVWGANHNYFNTEWQESDSQGCEGAGNTPLFETEGVSGSDKQQQAGLHALMGFFRANVGANKTPDLLKEYDPEFGVPDSLTAITHIGRTFEDSASAANSQVLENFATAGATTALSGDQMVATGLTMTKGAVPEHDRALRAASIKWQQAGGSLEIPVGAVNASNMATLDMRVSLQDVSASVATPTSFSIQLVNADGSASNKVSLDSYLDLEPGGHAILETARIPLKDFGATANLGAIKSVKLLFDETTSGSVYVASIRVTRPLAPTGTAVAPGTIADLAPGGQGNATKVVATGNSVTDISTDASGTVAIALNSPAPFVVNDELPHLLLGDQSIDGAGYQDDGDTHNIVFKLTPDQYAAVQDGSPMKVQYGKDIVSHEWQFGNLDKSQAH